MYEAVSWILHLDVREGRLDEFRSLAREMVDSTRSEPGALAYEWFLDETGGACHIYERYADSQAALAHIATFGEKFAERFLACVEPTGAYVYGDPSAEVRAALDGLGAAYLAPLDGFHRG